MYLVKIFPALIWLFLWTNLNASGNGKDSTILIDAAQDEFEMEAGAYLNHLDSFIINLYYSKILELQDAGRDPEIAFEMPEDRDNLYQRGLAELNIHTPFDLSFNPYVSAFVDLYLFKKRRLTESCLGLSEYYFPVFEELLDKYNLPIEFKYLAIVESALNITARSRAGAAGLWQFMYRTGKVYGLEINSVVDDRYELYASTDAACRYFRDLFNIYGNWELVIAAYNCGPGNVNKAIRRSGGKRNYWEIRSYLPKETRGYVPAFIAVNYALHYAELYGLKPKYADSLNLLTDTLVVNRDIDLNEFCNYFCADIDQLRYLNPSYKLARIPESNTLRLPLVLANEYIVNENKFNAYVAVNLETVREETKQEIAPASGPTGKERTHIVRSGEVLGVIAEMYNCRVSQIMDWNNLYSSRIYEGQKLIIYSDRVTPAVQEDEKKITTSLNVKGHYKYHVIREGDTLWDIAKMYDGITVTELRRLNKGLNHKNLKPGTRIIISVDS